MDRWHWRGIGLLATSLDAAVLRRAVSADVILYPDFTAVRRTYTSAEGAGCFPVAGVCVTAGSLTLTSLVTSTFNLFGQDIVADALYSGQLTTLGGMLLGPVTLSGTVEQEVLGRTFSIEAGSWTTDLTALDLSGPVLGHTVTLGLDAGNTSSGTTSAGPSGGQFVISSFFSSIPAPLVFLRCHVGHVAKPPSASLPRRCAASRSPAPERLRSAEQAFFGGFAVTIRMGMAIDCFRLRARFGGRWNGR